MHGVEKGERKKRMGTLEVCVHYGRLWLCLQTALISSNESNIQKRTSRLNYVGKSKTNVNGQKTMKIEKNVVPPDLFVSTDKSRSTGLSSNKQRAV